MKDYFFLLLTALTLFPSSYLCAETSNARGLIMIDKRGGLVRFFDPQTFSEISNLSIDGIPHELSISPDGNTAYVPDYGDGVYGNNPNPGHKIAVIDLPTRRVRATIDISPYQAPHGVQVDRNGTLYVSCDLSRKMLIIDPKTLRITDVIDTEGTGHWLAVLPDGSKAYIANKNDRLFVSVIDLREKKMMGKVPMPNGTQGITVSPDGQFVLAMDLTEPFVWKIDTSTDKVVEKIAIKGNTKGIWGARYTPNGQQIVVINVRERTANVLAANDLEAAQWSVSVGSQPFGIAFTQDSQTALISNHGDGTISVVDLDSQQVIKSFSAGKGIETLAFY